MMPEEPLATTSGPGDRVLLIEFLNSDAFDQHRSQYFPFIQGFLRHQGAVTFWVSLAAGKEARPNHPYVVVLPTHQRDILFGAVCNFQPSHVIVNEKIDVGFLDALKAIDSIVDVIEPPRRLHTQSIEEAVPDYEQERLDPDEPTADHMVSIVSEPRCLYNRSVVDNPYFSGLDVASLRHGRGCSFCANDQGDMQRMSPARVVDHLILQIQRYVETVPVDQRRRRFSIFTAVVFQNLHVFLERFIALDLSPSQLFLTCRIDELLRVDDVLRAALPAIERLGHELCFWQIGLENFSPVENERFNKGITTKQIESAVSLINEFEESWPRSFSFRRHGGFASILFTPWTTLNDLKINLHAIQQHRLPFDLTTRLMLRAETPLERLAAHDDLIAKCNDEQDAFGTYCITHWGEEEIPWRFQKNEVANVYRLFNGVFPRDGRSGGVFKGTDESEGDPLRTLELLINLVENKPDASSDDLAQLLSCGFVSTRRQQVVQQLTHSVIKRFPEQLDGMVATVTYASQEFIEINVEIHDTIFEIALDKYNLSETCLFHTTYFNVIHRQETPVTSSTDRQKIKRLIQLFEKAAERLVPEVLPNC